MHYCTTVIPIEHGELSLPVCTATPVRSGDLYYCLKSHATAIPQGLSNLLTMYIYPFFLVSLFVKNFMLIFFFGVKSQLADIYCDKVPSRLG